MTAFIVSRLQQEIDLWAQNLLRSLDANVRYSIFFYIICVVYDRNFRWFLKYSQNTTNISDCYSEAQRDIIDIIISKNVSDRLNIHYVFNKKI